MTKDLLHQSQPPHPLLIAPRLYPSPLVGEGLIPAPLARSGRGAGGEGHIRARGLKTETNQACSTTGKVYLVGAGPGDPGLMTVKGKALLEHADCVIHDALISPAILAMMNPNAEQIHAGKRRGQHSLMQTEITALLIAKAQEHAVVVRLKGGDPFVFGRGGEEMMDLIQAGISVEIVPGITAGVAAPAYAGIPITHRNYGSSVTFVTGHEHAGKYQPQVNWAAIAQSSDTIVIYMGIHNLAHILPALQAGGKSPETPIALIQWGTCPNQTELVGTFATILQQIEETGFDAPAIAVVGNVVNLHELLGAAPHQS